jgi:hypothetical protein
MLGTALRMPGAFNMMAVDNGGKRVMEIVPAGAKNGVYPRAAGSAFEPAAPLWTYSVNDLQMNEGSVQRLPNGNTLICTGGGGMGGASCRVFELNPDRTAVVWELTGIPQSTEGIRYAYGYLGGKVPVTPDAMPDFSTRRKARIVTNPLAGHIGLVSDFAYDNARFSMFSINGRELVHPMAPTLRKWNIGNLPNGQYLIRINYGKDNFLDRLVIRQ